MKSASAGARAPDARAVERALKRLRDNIDQVDGVLVKLLNQRARWALEIGEVKKEADLPIYQPDREKEVLSRVQEQNRGPLGQSAVQRLFERIIDESRRLERIGGEDEDGGGAPAPGSAKESRGSGG
ncbi:MAG TPA: chorismate mutase [Thermoanaerobaculia bacterium]|nr:chorismate mutase [Thermoanaerobaculia bacterium]